MMTVACDFNLKNSKNKQEKQIQFTMEDENEVKCWNFGGIEININEGITCSVNNNNNNNNDIIMIILIVTLENFGGIEININEGITCSINNNNNDIIMIILIVTLKISNQKPYNYNCQEYLKLDQKLKRNTKVWN